MFFKKERCHHNTQTKGITQKNKLHTTSTSSRIKQKWNTKKEKNNLSNNHHKTSQQEKEAQKNQTQTKQTKQKRINTHIPGKRPVRTGYLHTHPSLVHRTYHLCLWRKLYALSKWQGIEKEGRKSLSERLCPLSLCSLVHSRSGVWSGKYDIDVMD